MLQSLPSQSEFELTERRAQLLLDSGLLPTAIKTVAQVITVAAMGDALRIHPIAALQGINVISGKPTPSVQLMIALAHRGIWDGTRWVQVLQHFELVEQSDERCVLRIQRKGHPMHTEIFTHDDDLRMQIWDNKKGGWVSQADRPSHKSQPSVMLKWRCISAAMRTLFPDVLNGMVYTPEEMGAEVAVTEDGDMTIIDADAYGFQERAIPRNADSLDPDDLRNQAVRSSFFQNWIGQGYRQPLTIVNLTSLSDWTYGRKALDALIGFRLNLNNREQALSTICAVEEQAALDPNLLALFVN